MKPEEVTNVKMKSLLSYCAGAGIRIRLISDTKIEVKRDSLRLLQLAKRLGIEVLLAPPPPKHPLKTYGNEKQKKSEQNFIMY